MGDRNELDAIDGGSIISPAEAAGRRRKFVLDGITSFVKASDINSVGNEDTKPI